MANARSLRSFDGKGKGIKVFGYLLGHLLLRTIDRAQRIHLAMLCRGFDGEIRVNRRLEAGIREVIFTIAWSAFFIAMRFYNLPLIAGSFITEFTTDLCERTIVIHKGQVMADGPTAEIFMNQELLAESHLEKPLRMQGCPVCGKK